MGVERLGVRGSALGVRRSKDRVLAGLDLVLPRWGFKDVGSADWRGRASLIGLDSCCVQAFRTPSPSSERRLQGPWSFARCPLSEWTQAACSEMRGLSCERRTPSLRVFAWSLTEFRLFPS